jgi:hypothetical protein
MVFQRPTGVFCANARTLAVARTNATAAFFKGVSWLLKTAGAADQ